MAVADAAANTPTNQSVFAVLEDEAESFVRVIRMSYTHASKMTIGNPAMNPSTIARPNHDGASSVSATVVIISVNPQATAI